MRTLLRHYSCPDRTTDSLGVPETVLSPTIAVRVRQCVEKEITANETLRRRHDLGKEFGLFLDEFHDRPDATHTAMMAHVIFVFNLSD